MKIGESRSLIELFDKQNVQYYARVTQRNFDWTKKELERYWEDLIKYTNTDIKKHHFMDTTVNKPNLMDSTNLLKYISITDGQQRMTLTTLNVASICAFVKNNNVPKEEFDYENIRNTLLINPTQYGEDRYKLLLRKKDRDTLKMIIDELPAQLSKNAGSPKIITAYNYLYNKLNITNYQEIFDKLWLMSTFEIIVEQNEDENEIYESINTSGRSLSDFDQVRAFVLDKYPLKEQEKINDIYWEDISKNKSPKTVLRTFNLFKNLSVQSGDTYNVFKDIAVEYDSFDYLNRDIKHYYEVYYSFERNTFENEELRWIVKGLNLVKDNSIYPALIRIYSFYENGEITEKTLLETLTLLRNVLLRLKLRSKGTYYEIRRLFELSIKWINPDNLYNDVYQKLSPLFVSDTQFEMIISSKNFYRGKQNEFETENNDIPSNINQITDYLLISIENAHHGKGRINPKHYSKEHICPQTLDNGWEHFFTREDHHDYVHCLGNITLLAKSYNSSNSNNSFEDKKNNPNGFKDDKLYLNQCIISYTTWTVDAIKQRTEKLAKEICEIFNIPINLSVNGKIKAKQSLLVGGK